MNVTPSESIEKPPAPTVEEVYAVLYSFESRSIQKEREGSRMTFWIECSTRVDADALYQSLMGMGLTPYREGKKKLELRVYFEAQALDQLAIYFSDFRNRVGLTLSQESSGNDKNVDREAEVRDRIRLEQEWYERKVGQLAQELLSLEMGMHRIDEKIELLFLDLKTLASLREEAFLKQNRRDMIKTQITIQSLAEQIRRLKQDLAELFQLHEQKSEEHLRVLEHLAWLNTKIQELSRFI